MSECVQAVLNKLDEDFLPRKEWICDRLIEPLLRLSEKIISSRETLTVSILVSIVSVACKQASIAPYLIDKAGLLLTKFSCKVKRPTECVTDLE